MCILIYLIMIQQLPTRVLKLFIKRKIVSLLSFLHLVQRTTKLHDLISSIYIYTYVRVQVYAISRLQPHLHAAVIIRLRRVIPGPRVVVEWTENRARIQADRSPLLFLPISSFHHSRVSTKGNRQVFNYPDKIGEERVFNSYRRSSGRLIIVDERGKLTRSG